MLISQKIRRVIANQFLNSFVDESRLSSWSHTGFDLSPSHQLKSTSLYYVTIFWGVLNKCSAITMSHHIFSIMHPQVCCPVKETLWLYVVLLLNTFKELYMWSFYVLVAYLPPSRRSLTALLLQFVLANSSTHLFVLGWWEYWQNGVTIRE